MQNVLYHFRFPDGVAASCAVPADGEAEPANLPAWTALEFEQCPNLSLIHI